MGIDTLTGALRVGSAMGEAACRNLYSCPETENLVEGRRGEACVYSAPFCPGFAAGCSMCGIFNPGLCAGLCPVLASLAGQSGISATPPSLTIMCQRSEFFVVQSLCASVN